MTVDNGKKQKLKHKLSPRQATPSLRRYKLAIYDTFQQALKASDEIKHVSSQCDQLNLVIRQEGDMDNPKVLAIATNIKLFAGDAWTLIHERRLEDGWYDDDQE